MIDLNKGIKVNSDRSIRQKQGVYKLKLDLSRHGGGLLWWAAGFGKTHAITHLVNRPMIDKFPDAKVTILVGTNYLKEQWESRVTTENESVYTWQSLYNKPDKSIKSKLLVIDEAHTILSTEKYFNVFNVVDYDWVILLTATPRKSDIDVLINKLKIPISDKVTEEYAVSKGWVSQRLEYNIPVELSFGDANKLKGYETAYRKALLYLNPEVEDPEDYDGFADWSLVDKVMNKKVVGVKSKDGNTIRVPYFNEQILMNLNRVHGDSLDRFKSGVNAGKLKLVYDYPQARLLAKMRNTTKDIIIAKATECRKLLAAKNEILYNNPNKIAVIDKIISKINGKGFIFAMRSSICDNIANRVEGTKPYHNKVNKPKGLGLSKYLDQVMQDFKDDKLKAIISIRKIEAGADIPNISFAINHSYYSTWSSHKQKMGRATRTEKTFDKTALLINLYSVYPKIGDFIGNTTEYSWLKKAQKTSKGVIWLKSVDEINYNDVRNNEKSD